MKYLALLVVAICLSAIYAGAQFASKMFEYHPAPGQLINTEGAGSYSAAQSVVGSLNGMVSLGAFGGYVVYGFDKPIKNDPANPYNVDFTIFGNVQSDWAEPGIVMVMKDENQNGKPDETWYELAGSEYFFSTTKHKTSVTYNNPLFVGGNDVPWVSSENKSGFVFSNSFHKQGYFPSEQFFNGVSSEIAKFHGTLIADQIDLTNPAMVKCYHRKFGYADNNLRKNPNFNLPDNPYTLAVEGSGGDAMDISWAVDENGNYVDLDQIDFVKIYTGVLANAGWCGEISTEVCGIADVAANSTLAGVDKCIVINRIPGMLFSGDSQQLEAIVFDKGRRSYNSKINWSSSNNQVAETQPDGLLLLKNIGTVTVSATLATDPTISASFQLEVITPSKIEITMNSPVIRIDEESEVLIKVYNVSNSLIVGLNIDVNIGDKEVLLLTEKNGKYFIRGLSEGSSTIEAFIPGRPGVKTSAKVSVLPGSSLKEVFVTVKDDHSTFVPRNKFSVSNFNLNPFVDRASRDYNISNETGVTLAHAIASVFSGLGLSADFRFRDDEKGNGKLYAWKVPKGDPSNVGLVYGYGGCSTNIAYAKCWVVLLNNVQISNGFDQYIIKNGDELILYHVPDINQEWEVSCFIPDKSEVLVNDTIEVYSTVLTCAMGSEGKVQIKSSSPIQYQPVWVNNEAVYFNGNPVVTDETGTAALRFSEAGFKKIAAGIDEMVVNVVHPTSSFTITEKEQIKIWPQPARERLNIALSSPSELSIKIIDLSGRSVLGYDSAKSSHFEFSTETITLGLYILQVTTNKGINNHKILIQ